MKKLTALLFLFSLCSLQLVLSAPVVFELKTQCCPDTTKLRIPVKNIVKYHWTSSDCPIKAIVFDMNTGKKFCVDPTAGWVKNHMKVVDQKNNATVSLQTSYP
ncbi:hypothetical protein KOW79_007686 [Hemibagrus wyckioides]|uniref:Chemokine interleukin-8-like domain-containing protein n=1 Tax=Hemibagrus wyckioides TaxID=337641 RepID=A0A9D3SMF5_9TELE|nr:eotaxin-like [Hemibagrus wyckioides]KAG7329512.1 hypothetical protein KOW79_007686 [Hemibagrus wyckioides]